MTDRTTAEQFAEALAPLLDSLTEPPAPAPADTDQPTVDDLMAAIRKDNAR